MKRVYCLYRVSTKKQLENKISSDEDKENILIPMQKIECEKFVQRQVDWKIKKEFEEKGISGSKVSANDRDAIQEIKKAAENKEFDILLVFMADRIGRIDDETPFVVEYLVNQGVEVWSTREGQLKIENHTDKLTNYIRFWQASGESKKISERVRTRMRQLVADGVYTGGVLPFGYELVKSGRINKRGVSCMDVRIKESERKYVEYIFSKTLAGFGTHQIATSLNSMLVQTHKGKNFSATTIKRILENKLYIGITERGNTLSPKKEHLAIISESDFEKVQEILKKRSEKQYAKMNVASENKKANLLTGKIFCASCGGRLSPSSHKTKYDISNGEKKEYSAHTYYCYKRNRKTAVCMAEQGTYLAEKIDKAVFDGISLMLSKINENPNFSNLKNVEAQKTKNIHKKKYNTECEISKVKNTIAKLQSEISKALIGESNFTEADLAISLKMEKENLIELESKLEVLDNDPVFSKEKTDYKNDYRELKNYAKNFSLADKEEQKVILGEIVQKIEVMAYSKITVYIKEKYGRYCFDADEKNVIHVDAEKY